MSDCTRKGKLFGGCKFIPVYDEKPNTLFTQPGGQCSGLTRSDILLKTYAGSLCTTCGKEGKP